MPMTSHKILSKEFLSSIEAFKHIPTLHVDAESIKKQEMVDSVKFFAQTLVEVSKNYASELTRDDYVKLYNCLDITTLSSMDNDESVAQFCKTVKDRSVHDGLTPGAVCVYPVYAKLCSELLEGVTRIAVVEDAFPHGQSPIEARVFGVKKALECGAQEIDMVIRRGLVLSESYSTIEHEVSLIRQASEKAYLKVILNTTEMKVGNESEPCVYERVFNASVASLKGGAHMLKTSTGKEGHVAHLEHSIIMYEAVKHLGVQCGFKAAGGVRTIQDALSYYLLALFYEVQNVSSNNFRIGASALADEIVRMTKKN